MAVALLMKPLHNLHPGEWYFGAEYERLHTVLGSCIALTAWHPVRKVGGMCHYLLPAEPKRETPSVARKEISARLISEGDCRYADNALEQMKRSMQRYGNMNEFQLGIFGGGDMFPCQSATSIGHKNIAYVNQWLMAEKLKPIHVDVGESISRSLVLVIPTGEILLKHYRMNQPS